MKDREEYISILENVGKIELKKIQYEKMIKKINSQITKIARHLVRAFL